MDRTVRLRESEDGPGQRLSIPTARLPRFPKASIGAETRSVHSGRRESDKPLRQSGNVFCRKTPLLIGKSILLCACQCDGILRVEGPNQRAMAA